MWVQINISFKGENIFFYLLSVLVMNLKYHDNSFFFFPRIEELQKYQYDCYLIPHIFKNSIVLNDLLEVNDTTAYINNSLKELH